MSRAGVGVEKGEPSFIAGGDVSWCSHCGKQWMWLRKLKSELTYDSPIPLLGVYPDITIIRKDTGTSMFIAALFTIAKTWKNPKCLLTDECIKKMGYIYTMKYYAAIEMKDATWSDVDATPGVGDGQGGLACCSPWGRQESDTTERLNWTELDATTDYHTKWGKWERQSPHGITYVWNLNYGTNKFIYETETESEAQRIDGWLPRRRERAGESLGSADAN